MKQQTKRDLFASIDKEEVENILQQIGASKTSFAKGEILALEDEPCNRLILLTKGKVRAEMTDPMGKTVKVEDITAPNPLAILFLFGENSRFPVQVTAEEDTVAIIVPKQSVLKMLHLNEKLLENYLNISAQFASTLSRKLHLMSFRTIRQKIAIYLLNLAGDDKKSVELDRSQNSLSEYFGVSRPSLTRELHNMQTDGLIEIEKKTITLKNKDRLTQLVKFG